MKLIVGLGNYQKQYLNTRHNMGFMVVDEFAASFNLNFKQKDNYLYAKTMSEGETIILVKPLTNMNLSGLAVKSVMNYFNIDIDDLLVVSDDMDLKPGYIRLRKNGSSGHQKGLQNIIDILKTENFKRLRVGIGRPINKDNINFVLGVPPKEEQELIDAAIDNAVDTLVTFIKFGIDKTMSVYKSKVDDLVD